MICNNCGEKYAGDICPNCNKKDSKYTINSEFNLAYSICEDIILLIEISLVVFVMFYSRIKTVDIRIIVYFCCMALVIFVKTIIKMINYKYVSYNFYEDKVEYVDVKFNKEEKSLKYNDIKQVSYKQNLLEKMFKIGTILILTNGYGQESIIRIKYIEDSYNKYKKVKEIIQK